MNIGLILYITSITIIFESLFMLFPILVSFIYGGKDLTSLTSSFLITFIFGFSVYQFSKKYKKNELKHREAFFTVTFSWVIATLFASLPYLLSGSIGSLTDAYFEAMAGFTTTGSSVVRDVEIMPKGVLFWRSLTQWMGGMGIILFALAVLPILGTGGMQLFKAEVPEISVDKLRPRIIDTAKALWFIYTGLTVLCTAVYIAGGMGIFDAINHSFTTMATGGFSTKNASLAHFKSPTIEFSSSLFMFLAGVNYSLYFYVFRRNISRLFKSEEFRFYLLLTITSTLLITLNLINSTASIIDSFRLALFQVTSIMTTTGYASADFEKWPPLSLIILVIIMFAGGMIGSTGGGIKQVRILLTLKQGYREIYQLIHPRAVTTLKLDDRILSKEILGSIWGFFFLFILIWVIATAGMAATGTDIVTSTTTVISAMCNVGPALGEAGPSENYASLPVIAKWILIFCMLTGRLELYTVLILFIPQFWKK
ncbi:MAG: TrkH family potassium uptake protein [Thermodesulfovibrionales bacterium]